MPKYRQPHVCPVCRVAFKRLTPHLKREHLSVMKTEANCELYARYTQLKGKTEYRGRPYRVCPVIDCASIVADLPLHLRGRKHCFHREASRRLARRAMKVGDMEFTIPPPASDVSDVSGEGRMSTASDGDSREGQGPRRERSLRVNGEPARADRLQDGASLPAERRRAGNSNAGQRPRVTIRRGLLEDWKRYLCSQLGGSCQPARAAEYCAVVKRYLRHRGCLHNVSSMLHECRPQKLAEYLEEVGKGKSPYWGKAVMLYVNKFLYFLEQMELLPEGKHRMQVERCKGLAKTLRKQIGKHRIKAQTVKRRKLLNIDISEFTTHPKVVKGIFDMQRGVDASNKHLRRYLICRMLANSGARTGVIPGMTIDEVHTAEHVVGRDGQTFYVITVSDHKTGYQGPVTVPVTVAEYDALLNLCNYVQTSSSSNVMHPFVTGDGTVFTSSRVASEWSLAWNACGLGKKYGPFSPSDNRKHFVTFVLKKFPELREKLSKQMKHSPWIERTTYDLSTTASLSVELLETRKSLAFTPPRTASGRVLPTATISRAPPSDTESEQSYALSPSLPGTSAVPGRVLPTATISRAAPSDTESEQSYALSPSLPGTSAVPSDVCASTPAPMVLTPAPQLPTMSSPQPPDPSPECPQPLVTSSDITTEFICTTEFPSGVQDTVEQSLQTCGDTPVATGPLPRSSCLFSKEEKRTYSTGKTERIRRTWTKEGEADFSRDWMYEITLSAAVNKKPTKKAIEDKLGTVSQLKERWSSLSVNNIKDKIWVLAMRQLKISKR